MSIATKADSLRWKTHWTILGLAFHYAVTAYNHTLSTYINYTPSFYCKDEALQGTKGCVYVNGSTTDSCVSGYEFFSSRGDSSIVTEWNLICNDRLYQPLSTTLYFVGVTIGALVTGILADKLGRKPLVILCLYAHALLGIYIALFAHSFVLFVFLRACQGFFVQGLQSCTYTLTLELMPIQHRTAMGVFAESYWAMGLMLLALASFYIPQWRTLFLVLSIFPVILSLGYILYIPESKIWLQSSKKSKNNKTLTNTSYIEGRFKILSEKERKQDDSVSQDSASGEKEDKKSQRDLKIAEGVEVEAIFEDSSKKDNQEVDQILVGREKYVLEVLWLSHGLRKFNIIMVFNWFSTMVAYYTITFYIPNLSGDRHFNFLLGALMELVAYGIAYITLSRIGRRLPLSAYHLIGGIICCVVGFIPKGSLTTMLALVGKGSVVSAFCCLCLYTSELFPTTVRAAALGHCAFWGRIGSLLAPQMSVLGYYTNKSVPLIVVGCLSIFSCVIVHSLPETLGRPLPNTLHDVDSMNKSQDKKQTVLK